MNWRKINNIIHRDFGYFFFGMTIIYALSGIALNHLKDWNPSYIIEIENLAFQSNEKLNDLTEHDVKNLLADHSITEDYKSHYYPNNETLKIFLKDGSVTIDVMNRSGLLESVSRRPIFFEVNFLHYNPIIWWTYFSDFYSIGLIAISITGLFVLKGKNGITGRGAWLTAAGVIIPIIYLLVL